MARNKDRALGPVKPAAHGEGRGDPTAPVHRVRGLLVRRVVVGAGVKDLTGEEAELPYRGLGWGEVGLLDADDPAVEEEALDVSILLDRAIVDANEPGNVPRRHEKLANGAVRR